MFLDHIVARAGRHVITIGPNGRSRIIRKEWTKKFVTIVFAERIFTRAYGIANRERSLALCCRRRTIGIYRWIGNGRRNELEWTARLRRASWWTRVRRVTGFPYRRLIGPDRTTRKDRHDDQPSARQLIVANDRVAVV